MSSSGPRQAPLVVVRGLGDVGSATAHVLFGAGYAVVLHDDPAPATSRRRMAFADAAFDGRAVLDGLVAHLALDRLAVEDILREGRDIPVVTWSLRRLLRALRPAVLVDARMRKRARAEPQKGLAPLTIGLGPGFVAGVTADVVVETARGGRLGAAITTGESLPFTGVPGEIGGYGKERFVYAPAAGVFRTRLDVGATVARGQTVATLDGTPVVAPLDGVLRGIVHDGVAVAQGAKIVEVDPRGADAVVTGLGERPRAIAEAVLAVIREWDSKRA